MVRQPHPLGGILLIFSDITDELKLRSRFNAQIQVQRATLDKLNDAVAVFGSDGRLRLHNEAFETFWSLSADRIAVLADFDDLAELCKAVLPDPALWLGLKARVADPDPESRVAISGEGRTVDGRVAAWQTRPLPDGATLVAFSDVTARRGLEQALVQREPALAESQALKREFVGSVSYELRTPLTTIVGYSELLETMGDLPERSRQHAGAIRIAASQLARSIDDVLDMAQIDAGEMELSLGDLRVCDLLVEAGEKVRARVEGRGATLTVVCPADLKPIRADEHRIGQALDHLLENAAPRRVRRRRCGAEGRDWPVRIRLRCPTPGAASPITCRPTSSTASCGASAAVPASAWPWSRRWLNCTAAGPRSRASRARAPPSSCTCRWAPRPPPPRPSFSWSFSAGSPSTPRAPDRTRRPRSIPALIAIGQVAPDGVDQSHVGGGRIHPPAVVPFVRRLMVTILDIVAAGGAGAGEARRREQGRHAFSARGKWSER